MATILLYEAEDSGRSDTFSLDVGTVDGPDNIKLPQLSPKARHDTETVEWQMGTTSVTGWYVAGAIGIWGLENFTGATVEVFEGVTNVPGVLISSRGTAVSAAHAIFIFDQQQTISGTLRVKVRKNLETFTADRLRIGYMQVYQTLTADEIADAGWSVTPLRTSIREDSQGGQIFGSSGSTRRVLTVNQGVINTDILSRVPAIQTPLPIPAGTLTGNWTSPSTDRYTLTAGGSGTITLPGVLTGLGGAKWLRYRIDVSISSPQAGAGTMQLDVESESGNDLFIRPKLTQGINLANTTTSNANPRDDLVIRATSEEYAVTVDIISLHAFDNDVNTADVPPESSGYPNLLDAIRSSGPDRPIGLLLRADNLDRLDEMLFYGLPDWGSYTDLDGDLTGGSFTLTESL